MNLLDRFDRLAVDDGHHDGAGGDGEWMVYGRGETPRLVYHVNGHLVGGRSLDLPWTLGGWSGK